MKKFREKLAAKAGFTLVELIVVIAILAILAAVAVPAYTGYIRRANDAAVLSEFSGVLTAAQAANATNTNEISRIEVTNAGVVTVTLENSGTLDTNYYSTFAELYGDATATNNASVTITGLSTAMTDTSYSTGAYWESNEWHAGSYTAP